MLHGLYEESLARLRAPAPVAEPRPLLDASSDDPGPPTTLIRDPKAKRLLKINSETREERRKAQGLTPKADWQVTGHGKHVGGPSKGMEVGLTYVTSPAVKTR